MQRSLFSIRHFWAIYIDNFHYYFESLCIVRQNFLGMCNECLAAWMGCGSMMCTFYVACVVTYMVTTMGNSTWPLAQSVLDPVCLQF